MEAFYENLSTIVRTCQAHGVPVILGTVPSNLWRPVVLEKDLHYVEKLRALYDEGKYEEGLAFARSFLRDITRHQTSDVENEIIQRIGQEAGVPVVDVERVICEAEPHGVPGETLLYDDCHLDTFGQVLMLMAYDKAIQLLLRTGT